jgi:hypothetical protein
MISFLITGITLRDEASEIFLTVACTQRDGRAVLLIHIPFACPQTRRSAHPAKWGESRVAQERQQMAERAYPPKRGDGPVAVLLQQINRPRELSRCRSRWTLVAPWPDRAR